MGLPRERFLRINDWGILPARNSHADASDIGFLDSRHPEALNEISPYLIHTAIPVTSAKVISVGRKGPNRMTLAIGNVVEARAVGGNAKAQTRRLDAASLTQREVMQGVARGRWRVIQAASRGAGDPSASAARGILFGKRMYEYIAAERARLEKGILAIQTPDSPFFHGAQG